MEQHLLLAAAGVRPGNGYEGYYRNLETTMQIRASEYFRKHVVMDLESIRILVLNQPVLRHLSKTCSVQIACCEKEFRPHRIINHVNDVCQHHVLTVGDLLLILA